MIFHAWKPILTTKNEVQESVMIDESQGGDSAVMQTVSGELLQWHLLHVNMCMYGGVYRSLHLPYPTNFRLSPRISHFLVGGGVTYPTILVNPLPPSTYFPGSSPKSHTLTD